MQREPFLAAEGFAGGAGGQESGLTNQGRFNAPPPPPLWVGVALTPDAREPVGMERDHVVQGVEVNEDQGLGIQQDEWVRPGQGSG